MIKGVIIKKLERYDDERGWLIEIHRQDADNHQAVMSYVSHTKSGVARGPHEHIEQSDFFVFVGPGDFELHLWDNRKGSETYGQHNRVIVGENNKVSVLIPPGVVHGYKSISENGSFSINLPDKLYKGKDKKEEIDEIRHEEDKDSRFIIK